MAEMYDPLLKCPYDESHSILRSRMQFHLVRCSKNHIGTQKLKCPFDAVHVIEPWEYEYHLSVCETGANMITQNFVVGVQPRTETLPIERAQCQSLALMTENWDEDSAPVASYDPEHHIETRNITRMLIGASKAKKKQFRQAERMRLQALSEVSAPPPVHKPKANAKADAPLRAPRLQQKVLAEAKANVDLDNIDMNKLSISTTSIKRDSKPNVGLESIDISKLLIAETSNKRNKKKRSSKTPQNVTNDEHSKSEVSNNQSDVKLERIISDSVWQNRDNNASIETATSVKPQMHVKGEPEEGSSILAGSNIEGDAWWVTESVEEYVGDDLSSGVESVVTTKAVSTFEDQIVSVTSESPILDDDIVASSSKNLNVDEFNNEQNVEATEPKKEVLSRLENLDEANSSEIPNSKQDDTFSKIVSRLNSLSAIAKFYADEKTKLDQIITEYVTSTSNANLTDVLKNVSLTASGCDNPLVESETNGSGVNRRCAANFDVPDFTRPSAGRGITRAYRMSQPGAASTSFDTCSNFDRKSNANQKKIESHMKHRSDATLQKCNRNSVNKDVLQKGYKDITGDSLSEVKENLQMNRNDNDDKIYETSSIDDNTSGWTKISSRKHKPTNASQK